MVSEPIYPLKQEGTPRLKPVVWTIAGSDSGGGAGIQADLATLNDLQCHACTVITAVTAQNSIMLDSVNPVDASILLAQLNCLLRDLPPDAIKIGLIADQTQLNMLANWLATELEEYKRLYDKQIPIILDPVMLASCGEALTSVVDYSVLKGLLTLITPNAKELSRLSGETAESIDDFADIAVQLAASLQTNLLLKGGDKGGFWDAEYAKDLFICRGVTDVSLSHQGRHFILSSPRSDNPNSHGCGCTLSSAIAAFSGHGYVLHDAILLAKAYVSQGIAHGQAFGKGAGPLARMGWPSDLAQFPHISTAGSDVNGLDNGCGSVIGRQSLPETLSFAQLTDPLDIYPVVDGVVLLESLLLSGATTVQLRLKVGKMLDEQRLEQEIIKAIALGRRYQAQVFINDHWQLALKHGAFGVHLGQEDLYDADLVQIAAKGLALGISSHGYFELKLAAQIKPSYIALGHIFVTTTKQMPSKPQGVRKLSRYAQLLAGHFPSVAIGGIDAQRLEDVKSTGVDGIAVVRAISHAASPVLAYQSLYHSWRYSSVPVDREVLAYEH